MLTLSFRVYSKQETADSETVLVQLQAASPPDENGTIRLAGFLELRVMRAEAAGLEFGQDYTCTLDTP